MNDTLMTELLDNIEGGFVDFLSSDEAIQQRLLVVAREYVLGAVGDNVLTDEALDEVAGNLADRLSLEMG